MDMKNTRTQIVMNYTSVPELRGDFIGPLKAASMQIRSHKLKLPLCFGRGRLARNTGSV